MKKRSKKPGKPPEKVPSQIRITCEDASPVRLEAAAEAEDGKPTLRRFTMTAYTGGAMTLVGWRYPVVVDLSGLRVTKASLGASADKVVFIADERKATANGREFTGPVYIARKSTLGEVSFVALGADDDTSARVAAGGGKEQDLEVTTMEFEQWAEENGFDVDELDDKIVASLKSVYEREQELASKAKQPAKPDEPIVPIVPVDAGTDGGSVTDPIVKTSRAMLSVHRRLGASMRRAVRRFSAGHRIGATCTGFHTSRKIGESDQSVRRLATGCQ